MTDFKQTYSKTSTSSCFCFACTLRYSEIRRVLHDWLLTNTLQNLNILVLQLCLHTILQWDKACFAWLTFNKHTPKPEPKNLCFCFACTPFYSEIKRILHNTFALFVQHTHIYLHIFIYLHIYFIYLFIYTYLFVLHNNFALLVQHTTT
jgi:hypothetical protein